MAARAKRRDRIYWRERQGQARAYGDFRDYADVGGKRERLIASGERVATTDPDVAAKLCADRVRALDAQRHGRALHGEGQRTTLAALADLHLRAKHASGKFTEAWIATNQKYLTRILERLGAERDPATVTVAEVQKLVAWLTTVPTNRRVPGTNPPRRGTLSGVSINHHLAALSNLYERATEQEVVPPGYNPVARLMDKPRSESKVTGWLEIPDAAFLLEAARTYRAPVDGTPFAYPLLATLLLTGGRESEVYGLTLDDISFDRMTITFRPNRWRRLKNRSSNRVVPLWPQLSDILRGYLRGPHRPTGDLLFPSRNREGREALLTDCRKLLDHLGARGGWAKGELRTRVFRTTYCSARLQTLDGDRPVAVFTVSRELGHSSTAMVEKVYSRLGTVRHRSTCPEFRVDQHPKRAAQPAPSPSRPDGIVSPV